MNKSAPNKVVIIEPHYLPSLAFFCGIISADEVVLEVKEHFEKQSCRNRCYINTDKGIQLLSVPITKTETKMVSKNVRIDYQSRWQNIHWRTIQSAYAKAPFYEHYSEALKEIIYQKHEFLFTLNLNILSLCLKNLKLSIPISETVSYEKEVGKEIKDLRSIINAKKHDKALSFYNSVPYYQVFGNTFVNNLSLIDLLFCAGPDSLRILKASQKVDLNK